METIHAVVQPQGKPDLQIGPVPIRFQVVQGGRWRGEFQVPLRKPLQEFVAQLNFLIDGVKVAEASARSSDAHSRTVHFIGAGTPPA